MGSSGRNVSLAKRDDFFSDPFFSDILSESDELFQKKLSLFKSDGLIAHKTETAHNLQVSVSNDKFLIQLELPGFLPDDFSLKTRDDLIILEANQNYGADDMSSSHKYYKEFNLPSGVLRDQISSAYTSEGVLTISAPRQIEIPEGAELSESLTAASKAFTTEDGTQVSQDSSASSQMMATSTQSQDGLSSSSMSFSSSNFSSSTMTSSSNVPGGLSGLGLERPSLTGMSNMDDMMKNMMSRMSFDDNLTSGLSSSTSSSTRMMSSSKMSSSSSTSSSNMIQKSSPLRGTMSSLPRLNIEELSTGGNEGSFPSYPYTVTSPPPSQSKISNRQEMNHTVNPAAGFLPSSSADSTVLLKLKQGQEYKLVLNMQIYKPENIVVKLNDRTLTISAEEGSSEKFCQEHTVPPGIDVDALSSSFSSDGILVIRAPRCKS